MKRPATIPQLIDAFGGATSFGRVIGKIPSTASEMKRTGAIGIKYWPKVINTAAKLRIPGVSAETLLKMHVGSASQ